MHSSKKHSSLLFYSLFPHECYFPYKQFLFFFLWDYYPLSSPDAVKFLKTPKFLEIVFEWRIQLCIFKEKKN